MSYIAPNSDIYLLANIPLDKTYDHTIRWDSLQAQYTYFTTRGSANTYHLTGYSYQRVNSNTLKVEFSTGNIYKYNYLMFKNTSFENKWFYAFIDRVDYINNNVYQITYELDVMQTWYFDYSVDEVFIERENVKDDTVGANLVEENLDIGDYIWGVKKFYPIFRSSGDEDEIGGFVIMSTTDEDGNPFVGTALYNHTVYSGLNFIYCNSVNELTTTLNNIVSAVGADGIIGIYEIPTYYKAQLDPSDVDHEARFTGVLRHSTEVDDTGEDDLNGYVPINKKLLCYPYNCLTASNNRGDMTVYRYEFFPVNEITGKKAIWFRWYANAIGDFTLVYVPAYKGISTDPNSVKDFSNAIKVSGTQMCSWVNDFWKAYKAQHLNRLAVEGIGASADASLSIVSAFGGLPTTTTTSTSGKQPVTTSTTSKNLTSDLGNATSGVLNYASLLAKIDDFKRLPPTAHTACDSDTLYINQQVGLTLMQQCITSEYAERIDRYFSKYGYRVKSVKKPAVFTNQRCTHWNFINTIGCTLTGSVPNDDLNSIASIYDKGITFWDDPAHIGEYSYYNWDCGRT